MFILIGVVIELDFIQQDRGTMYLWGRLAQKLRPRLRECKRNLRIIEMLLIFSLLLSLFSPCFSSSMQKSDYSGAVLSSTQSETSGYAESYTITRREAIVDYVKALQAPEGYFHGYLQEPPPFEPDGTAATYHPVQDAYGIVKYIGCVDELDWSSTVEFLLSLVDGGFLNMSKLDGPSVYTCWTALTLLPNLDINSGIDVNDNVMFIASLQQTNGGFLSERWDVVPTLVRTYYALDALRIAGRLYLIDLAAARSFVLGCYKADGGFSNTLGGESDFNYAPAGIYLMEILGLQNDLDVDLTTSYLLQFWDNESGCDVQADLLFTQRIAWSLWLLDKEDSIDTTKLLQWVLGLQKHAHGEFVGYPEAGLDNERLVFANYATHILAMYNGTSLLDSEFLVEEKPVWTIPQWWIDYINSEWNTISNTNGGPYNWFAIPDLSFLIPLVPYMLVVAVVIAPALWMTARSRAARLERRELKKKRKKRYAGDI
jgi:prenyltransferase beta subunit